MGIWNTPLWAVKQEEGVQGVGRCGLNKTAAGKGQLASVTIMDGNGPDHYPVSSPRVHQPLPYNAPKTAPSALAPLNPDVSGEQGLCLSFSQSSRTSASLPPFSFHFILLPSSDVANTSSTLFKTRALTGGDLEARRQ